MAKTVATFRQADLTRAVKAARALGLDVVATEIGPDGTIRLEHKVNAAPTVTNPFDKYMAERNARQA